MSRECTIQVPGRNRDELFVLLDPDGEVPGDCDGREFPPDGEGLPCYPVTVDEDGKLDVDLNAEDRHLDHHLTRAWERFRGCPGAISADSGERFGVPGRLISRRRCGGGEAWAIDPSVPGGDGTGRRHGESAPVPPGLPCRGDGGRCGDRRPGPGLPAAAQDDGQFEALTDSGGQALWVVGEIAVLVAGSVGGRMGGASPLAPRRSVAGRVRPHPVVSRSVPRLCPAPDRTIRLPRASHLANATPEVGHGRASAARRQPRAGPPALGCPVGRPSVGGLARATAVLVAAVLALTGLLAGGSGPSAGAVVATGSIRPAIATSPARRDHARLRLLYGDPQATWRTTAFYGWLRQAEPEQAGVAWRARRARAARAG